MNFNLLITLLVFTVIGCKKKPDPSSPVTPVTTTGVTFTNPLLTSGPDPWVIQKDSFYYYTHTTGGNVRIWRTKSMSKLASAYTKIIWTKPASGPNSQNVWAPEIHYLDGKWYAYYTAGASSDLSTQRLFVLENTSADPLSGTWADKGKIYDPAADYFAIDGTVLQHNNKKYFIWSGHASASDNNQRLYIAEMSNPYTLATSRVLISSPTYTWERVGAPPAVNEGPEILKKANGRIFLIYSASGCWTDDYALGMMTLKDGGDPMNASDWIKSAQPVFTKNVSGQAFGPGHNSFFKSPDGKEDWIIYHANPLTKQGCGNFRSPRMQKFIWNADGTPNFETPVAVGLEITRPSGEKD